MDVKALIEEREKLSRENQAAIEAGPLNADQQEAFNKRNARATEIRKQLENQALVDEEQRDLARYSESRGRQTVTTLSAGSEPTARDNDLAFRAWALGRQATDEMRAAAARVGVRTDSSYIDMAIRSRFADGKVTEEFVPVRSNAHGDILEFRSHPETRALSSGTTTAGGDAIPTAMMQRYTEVQKWYATMSVLADVINTENGQSIPWPTVTDTANSARVLAEGTTATTSTDPTFSKVTLGAFKLSSDAVVVPWELLMDSFIDLNGWLGGALGRRIGRKKNSLFTAGAGTTEPKGIFAGATSGKTASATNAFTIEETIDLEHAVDPAYRALPGTGFMVHDTIIAYLRKLKDGSGRYYWEPSQALGQPDRFRGYPVFVNNDMDSALTTGKKLLGFGNVRAAFVVRNAGSVRFIRDESIYVKEHMVYFEALERCDSNVVDTTAFKYLNLA